MTRFTTILIVLMTCLSGFAGVPPTPADNNPAPRIDAFLKESMENFGIPGLAVSVIKNGEVIFSKGYGFGDLRSKTPVTNSTLFSTASVTKVFVGTAIMQLFEQGKMDLKNPVIHYLPYFFLNDPRYKKITILQMLNHTSGMPDIEDIEDYGWENPAFDDGALERYVRSLRNKKLLEDPGRTMNYSSMAYDVLGDVISKVSGSSFEEYVQTNILLPLKMTKSTLLYRNVDKNLLATPYQLNKNLGYSPSQVFPYSRMHPASGTLFSNVQELSRWAKTILNKGELEGKRILKEQSLDLMWRPANPEISNFGIAWMVEPFSGYTMISHDGGDPGYRTELRLIPEISLAVIIVRNCWEPPLDELASLVVKMAKGEDPNTRIVATMGRIWKILREEGIDEAIDHFNLMRRDLGKEYFHPSQLNKIGLYLTWLGRFEDAEKFYLLNVETFPDYPQLYIILADHYAEMGKVDLAIQVCKNGLEKNKGNERLSEHLEQLIAASKR